MKLLILKTKVIKKCLLIIDYSLINFYERPSENLKLPTKF